MTAIEEIEAAKAEAATVRTELDKATADLTAAHALIAETGAKVEALVAERDALAAQVKTIEATAAENVATLDEVRGELAEATGKLRNPAFAAAAIPESTSAPASADGGDSVMTRAQAEARYEAMPRETQEDARALAEFRAAHWQALGFKKSPKA